jgi:CRP-like cAMP-binding protein
VKKNETKVLAHLKKDDIFGEAALNSSEPKYASIKAKRKSLVIYINAKE